jgi:hypothetical protein
MLQKIEQLRKRITQRHKRIHLTLRVKTFFDNSTLATGSSTKSSTHSLDFPLMVINGIAGGKRERETAHKSYKVKLERLRSKRPTRHDQMVRLLDMPRLLVVKTLKPTQLALISYNQVLAMFKMIRIICLQIMLSMQV